MSCWLLTTKATPKDIIRCVKIARTIEKKVPSLSLLLFSFSLCLINLSLMGKVCSELGTRILHPHPIPIKIQFLSQKHFGTLVGGGRSIAVKQKSCNLEITRLWVRIPLGAGIFFLPLSFVSQTFLDWTGSKNGK